MSIDCESSMSIKTYCPWSSVSDDAKSPESYQDDNITIHLLSDKIIP